MKKTLKKLFKSFVNDARKCAELNYGYLFK